MTISESKYRILCVDDDEDTRDLLNYVLTAAGFEVEVCGTAEECLENAARTKFQAVVLDGFFGSDSSTNACRELRQIDPDIPIVYLSGEARRVEIEKALAAGANAYLVKPNDFEKLTSTVSKLIAESESCF